MFVLSRLIFSGQDYDDALHNEIIGCFKLLALCVKKVPVVGSVGQTLKFEAPNNDISVALRPANRPERCGFESQGFSRGDRDLGLLGLGFRIQGTGLACCSKRLATWTRILQTVLEGV